MTKLPIPSEDALADVVGSAIDGVTRSVKALTHLDQGFASLLGEPDDEDEDEDNEDE